MKKIFKRLCVTVLSFLMVVSSTTLPAFGEDINYNDEDINYNERNDIANSFRYSNGRAKKRGYANYAARASLNSGWPDDPKAICKGIDVSYHNGTIDWKRVKQSEVKYAIIRCGYGKNVKSQDDKKWEENVRGCTDNNIPYGVYLYSYADNVEKASSEADHAIRLLEGKKFKYPVYYDLEENKIRDRLTKQQIADIAQTFCDKLSAKGYTVGIYANKDWFTHYLTDSRFNNWTKWVAQYNTVCNYHGKYDMWQCSSTGSVPGISGRVDLNYSYSPFENSYGGGNTNNGGTTTKYSDGLNKIEGELYYFKNNRIDTSYTGLAQYGNEWYYIENGKVNWNYTGLAQKGNEWFYIEKGKLNWDHSGIVEYNNQWFYVERGRLNWNYTGLGQSGNDWYYIVGGRVNWDYIGLVQKSNEWFYVKGGKLDWNYTGLVLHEGTWYYVSKGRLDWNHSGLIYYNNDWFYIDHGYINWDYSNLIYYNNAWFYVYHGKIRWDYSDLVLYNGTWYYVKNGQIDWNFTDLVLYEGTWYYVKKAIIDYSYKGLVYHCGGYYYVDNGIINWGYNGYAKVNNKGPQYKVVNGHRV